MAKRPIRVQANPKNLKNTIQRKSLNIKKRLVAKNLQQDARQKLIQQKRKNVRDARDVLAKMARTQDARTKLENLRQKRVTGRSLLANNSNIKVIGTNIVQKTDRNGKITLTTNKKAKPPNNKPAIGIIKKELGLLSPAKKPVQVRRPVQARPAPQQRAPLPLYAEMVASPYEQLAAEQMRGSMYKWAKPALRHTASQLIGSLQPRLPKPETAFQGWQNFPVSAMRAPRGYEDNYMEYEAMDDEEMPLTPVKQTISLQGPARISNIHSRLDSQPLKAETHGILAQTKTKVVVPAGHRIVVSNLQATVTQDDVKELFEDIGHLLAARLVRPGVAEVIYKNLKDAQKAVDTYHNRQLDGQPMKCLLVNKRPVTNPLAPSLTKMQGFVKKAEGSQSQASSNKLVPDLSTIHRVLFQRK